MGERVSSKFRVTGWGPGSLGVLACRVVSWIKSAIWYHPVNSYMENLDINHLVPSFPCNCLPDGGLKGFCQHRTVWKIIAWKVKRWQQQPIRFNLKFIVLPYYLRFVEDKCFSTGLIWSFDWFVCFLPTKRQFWSPEMFGGPFLPSKAGLSRPTPEVVPATLGDRKLMPTSRPPKNQKHYFRRAVAKTTTWDVDFGSSTWICLNHLENNPKIISPTTLGTHMRLGFSADMFCCCSVSSCLQHTQHWFQELQPKFMKALEAAARLSSASHLHCCQPASRATRPPKKILSIRALVEGDIVETSLRFRALASGGPRSTTNPKKTRLSQRVSVASLQQLRDARRLVPFVFQQSAGLARGFAYQQLFWCDKIYR